MYRRLPAVALFAIGASAHVGCGNESIPFEQRLVNLERGERPLFVFSDLIGEPIVREAAEPVDESALPARRPPPPDDLPMPISPRGLTLNSKPRFVWLKPKSATEPVSFRLMIYEDDDKRREQKATATTSETSLESPVTLVRNVPYSWWLVETHPPSRGAKVPFSIADEKTSDAMRDAARVLERLTYDRSTSLLLKANLFESRGFFGDAVLDLLELTRLHPDSAYLKGRCHRLSVYP